MRRVANTRGNEHQIGLHGFADALDQGSKKLNPDGLGSVSGDLAENSLHQLPTCLLEPPALLTEFMTAASP